MLMPKRVKYRKQQRGRTKGMAQRGNSVAFGDYGLMALEATWITSRADRGGPPCNYPPCQTRWAPGSASSPTSR